MIESSPLAEGEVPAASKKQMIDVKTKTGRNHEV